MTRPPASYDLLPWLQEPGPCVFVRAVSAESDAFAADKTWMLNFRVRDLEAMVAQLRAAGSTVEVDPEVYPNGRFAQTSDPEGNPIQLWEPQGEAALLHPSK